MSIAYNIRITSTTINNEIKMSKTRKPGRGGKREGAGRPEKSYKSVRISFRVHPDLEDPIKKMVREFVKKHKAKINHMESHTNIPI